MNSDDFFYVFGDGGTAKTAEAITVVFLRHFSSEKFSADREVPSKMKVCTHRDASPEVNHLSGAKSEFDNFSPEIFYQVVMFLQPTDVHSCMRVCREWKLMLSTGYFWQNYLTHCFDFDDKEDGKAAHLTGMLHELGSAWCYGWGGGLMKSPLEDGSSVFLKFPKRWRSGIIHPVEVHLDSDVDYRALFEAVYQLEILQREVLSHEIVYIGPRKNRGECPVDVFLFPWEEEELPDQQALMEIFHFNQELTFDIVYQICEEKFGDGEQAEELFKCWRCSSTRCRFYDVLPKVLDGFAKIRVDFQGRTQNYRPCPEIIVTQLSPGWCGGILTGVW